MSDRSAMLLKRWSEGDTQAFSELVQQHSSWLHERVSSSLGPELRRNAETGDVVQEVLLDLTTYVPPFTPANEAQFRMLVARMVANRIKNMARSARAQRRDRRREEAIGDRSPSDWMLADASSRRPDRLAEAWDERRRHRALFGLAFELVDPEDQWIIQIRQLHQADFSQIGEELGITRGTAEKRFQRAVRRLGSQARALRDGRVGEAKHDSDPSDPPT